MDRICVLDNGTLCIDLEYVIDISFDPEDEGFYVKYRNTADREASRYYTSDNKKNYEALKNALVKYKNSIKG